MKYSNSSLNPGQSLFFFLNIFMCLIVFPLLYWSSLLSRSNSMQLTGSIPFLITPGNHRPHPNPYHPPPPKCLSVSEADSIDFRNHFISFSSSHKFTTKDKTPTLYTHHPTPLTVPNNPNGFSPPPAFGFFSHVHCSLPPSLVQKHV